MEDQISKSAAESVKTASVLIIEDDQFLRGLVAKKLKTAGFNVVEAVDGREGLVALKSVNPDAILLDLVLPGIDGFEILRLLKQDAETRHIPVVVLSNLGQKSEIDRAKELGAEDYLIKAHTDLNEIVVKINSFTVKS